MKTALLAATSMMLSMSSFAYAADHDMHSGHDDMQGMDMAGMDMSDDDMHDMPMNGFYGAYPMTRESSGTAWVPDSSPMKGIHRMYGDWTTMLHGYADLVYDNQGGKRGQNKTFSESMLMGMASHPLGGGTVGFRVMA